MSSRKYKVFGIRPEGVIAPHVNDDMFGALEDLGHEVMVVDARDLSQRMTNQGNQVWHDLVRDIKSFKPDFSVSYGMAGAMVFEKTGGSQHLLKEMGIPFFPCFFDDPLFTMGVDPGYKPAHDELLFIWDRGHLESAKQAGFHNVHHLPLGTNHKVFKPLNKPNRQYQHALSFVGSLANVNEVIDNIKGSVPLVQEVFERAIRRRMESLATPFTDILNDIKKHFSKSQMDLWVGFEQTSSYWVLMDSLNRVMNAIWREQMVTSIAINDIEVAVYGNEDWKSLNVSYQGEIDYHKHLPRLYSSTPLHLNLSAPQLHTSINNRVYDCLACGSAVLSDWRAEIEEHFEPGKEVLVFKTAEEGVELAREWAHREKDLKEMAMQGRKRVLAEHTWCHRMAHAVSIIQQQL